MELLAKRDALDGLAVGDAGTSLGCVLGLLMDELAHGVLVTTSQGRVVHANRAARDELGRRRVLESRHRMLHACAPGNARILQEALDRVTQGKRSLIGLFADEGSVVTLAVLPLKAVEAGRSPSVAWLFARPSVCEGLMLCFFARRHALTAAEEQVLGILCHGFSAPQIAVQLQVAVSTVRSHVRSLCAKTQSTGVRELVNRVAVLPAVAPAHCDQPVH
jgi:DNA-binding CsgD family transcriptional regulator